MTARADAGAGLAVAPDSAGPPARMAGAPAREAGAISPLGLTPHWTLPASVGALITTRDHGISPPPYGRYETGVSVPGGLNLGLHTGDDPRCVAVNRARVSAATGTPVAWLEQVHGTRVVQAGAGTAGSGAPRADACVADRPGVACAVMVADCLPVLIADTQGRAVGAAHAGWRGLADGVVEAAVAALATLVPPGATFTAWLGPCIGPAHFEVGGEVRERFLATASAAEREATALAFRPQPARPEKYLADLPALARLRLLRAGVTAIAASQACTYANPQAFYSYRRDRVTGRMAALIWLKT